MFAGKLRWTTLFFVLVLSGCSLLSEQEPTLTPSPLPTISLPTETFTPTPVTPTAEPPTLTVTPSLTPTETPSPTLTPTLEPPTAIPQPSVTPFTAIQYTNDQLTRVTIPPEIAGGIGENWLAFVNFNDRSRPGAPTPEGNTEFESLYMVRPDTRQRVKVAEIPSSTGDRVFWSPAGTHVAYFVEPGTDTSGNPVGGLYMIDFNLGVSYRLYDMPNLNPHGIPGHLPTWSGDGQMLAVALTTPYATDIFVVNADGSNFRNMTNHGSYDLWPAFSPDGIWLAFVSDRLICASHTPGDPGSCSQVGAQPPAEGNLFVQNMVTGELRQLTDIKLNGAPRWINRTKLAFSTGGGSPLATTSDLWMIDIEAGTAVQVSGAGSLALSEAWTDTADMVMYQRATSSTDIVLATGFGGIINTTAEYIFPRYGMAADWSPDGQYLAIGGRGGQCPYGMIIADPALDIVTEPVQTLLACDPKYAPDGRWLAFAAIQPSRATDGRLDVYIANPNGVGSRNVTSDLRGQMQLLGWIGPTPGQ